ncbi:MAG TPA: cytochrome c-type biogenesis protein [Usitatibacter sp.]|jgi:cytochrome c-type biogenesis protein CcmH/NrfF|nr:cytochrome c-type biogenesis protein [Usitatibacter sp.]
MARFVAMLLLAFASLAQAGEARPVAADPVLEARVSKLAQELRCLVCQNQTLEDSHAPLAIDLKNQVRDMLASGRSESEVVDYLVARYGDFVLYRPPLKATTLILWIGPLLLLAISLLALLHHIRRGTAAPADDGRIDAEAARRADALLGLHPGKDSP